MVLTREQTEQLNEASKPLIEFLEKTFHPHVHVIVTSTSVNIAEELYCTNRLGKKETRDHKFNAARSRKLG